MTSAEDRYRTLLDMSSNLAGQPTVEAVLHSLRGVLSSSCRLHGADLYVLSGDGKSLRLLDFDREADAPEIKVGTKLSLVGAAAEALQNQEPVFVPDTAAEMLKHPELAPFAAASEGEAPTCFPSALPRIDTASLQSQRIGQRHSPPKMSNCCVRFRPM